LPPSPAQTSSYAIGLSDFVHPIAELLKSKLLKCSDWLEKAGPSGRVNRVIKTTYRTKILQTLKIKDSWFQHLRKKSLSRLNARKNF